MVLRLIFKGSAWKGNSFALEFTKYRQIDYSKIIVIFVETEKTTKLPRNVKKIDIKPLAHFKIRPMGKHLQCEVIVYKSSKDLTAAHNYHSPFARQTVKWAIVEGFHCLILKKGKPVRVSPVFATLRITKHSLKMGVIAHESVHIAMRYLERRYKGFKMTGERLVSKREKATNTMGMACPEEQLATVVGSTAALINAAFHNLKLYD